MDTIYGYQPASNGRESDLVFATALFETMFEDGDCLWLRPRWRDDLNRVELSRCQWRSAFSVDAFMNLEDDASEDVFERLTLPLTVKV